MEVLGGGTTVISLLQTAWQVIEYVKAVKSAGEAQQKVLVELVRARTLLNSLSDLAEDFKDDEWSRALQSLGGPLGVLSEFKALLEWIMDDMGVLNSQQQGVSPSASTPEPPRFREKIRRKLSSRLSLSMRPVQKRKPNSPDYSHDQVSNTGMKDAIKDIAWPFKEAEIQKLLGKLESIKTQLLLALSSDNVRLSRLIRDELQSVHRDIWILREYQEGSKPWTTQQDLIFRSISRIKFSPDYFPDDIAVCKESASTLLDDHTFAQWLTDDTRNTSLLLSGIGGSGKTYMFQGVEAYLRTMPSHHETFVVAVYFSFRNRDRAQSLQAVLAFVVETMMQQRPQIQKYYNRLMLTGEGPLEVADSLRIIHRARQAFQRFYILMDGLDVCDAQQAHVIFERLTRLHNPLKIFATSRGSSLNSHFSNEIKMSQLIQDGIRTFIRRSVEAKVTVAAGSALSDHYATLERVTENILRRSKGQYV
jgi:hypothetical protein